MTHTTLYASSHTCHKVPQSRDRLCVGFWTNGWAKRPHLWDYFPRVFSTDEASFYPIIIYSLFLFLDVRFCRGWGISGCPGQVSSSYSLHPSAQHHLRYPSWWCLSHIPSPCDLWPAVAGSNPGHVHALHVVLVFWPGERPAVLNELI